MLQGPEKAARGDIETSPLAARRVDPPRWRIKLTQIFLQRNLQRTAGMVRHEFVKVQILACAPVAGSRAGLF
ncbi:gp110 [Mycobacterium phage Omega]|uniref:Uncharacterized protein n=1 Tax=Mycobacterium phage Omega TaxID=2907835 RepID=Q854F8_BPMOM|nr:gp110 [Mycobacterium phage Omega]AAN12750.1 hypothetical protein PBI_OMEGA_110 [Mycobacterium phage Omega]QPO16842.1 hypothetical protein SEA_KASHFLOW_96 [Mycobacterium phage KashFlow]